MLFEWSTQWKIPIEAVLDLQRRMGMLDTELLPTVYGSSEAAVQARLRVAVSKQGNRVWRNNVGVLKDARGVPVRFGLANDSPVVNAKIKSGDLIGIRQVRIEQAHVGHTLGQFYSIEAKEVGWRYTGDSHEQAQAAWINLINSMGGYARFSTGDL